MWLPEAGEEEEQFLIHESNYDSSVIVDYTCRLADFRSAPVATAKTTVLLSLKLCLLSPR